MYKDRTLLCCPPYEAVMATARAVWREHGGSKEAHSCYHPSIAKMALQIVRLPHFRPHLPHPALPPPPPAHLSAKPTHSRTSKYAYTSP